MSPYKQKHMASNQNQAQSDLWSELAQKAQAGDTAAYRTLLNDIAPFIKKVIAGRLSNPEWADDISQDVLMSVHKSLHTYQADRSFRPWLMAIINFRKTDYLRAYYRKRKNMEVSVDVLDFSTDHVTDSPHAGELKDVEKALDTLPQKQRDVFRMIKIEGHSIEDVAQKMDMSASAVKVSAHRSMKKLQKVLEA